MFLQRIASTLWLTQLKTEKVFSHLDLSQVRPETRVTRYSTSVTDIWGFTLKSWCIRKAFTGSQNKPFALEDFPTISHMLLLEQWSGLGLLLAKRPRADWWFPLLCPVSCPPHLASWRVCNIKLDQITELLQVTAFLSLSRGPCKEQKGFPYLPTFLMQFCQFFLVFDPQLGHFL